MEHMVNDVEGTQQVSSTLLITATSNAEGSYCISAAGRATFSFDFMTGQDFLIVGNLVFDKGLTTLIGNCIDVKLNYELLSAVASYSGLTPAPAGTCFTINGALCTNVNTFISEPMAPLTIGVNIFGDSTTQNIVVDYNLSLIGRP